MPLTLRVLVALFPLFAWTISAQNSFPDVVDKSDSVQYSYRFVKGDTLLYEVLSRDSIITDIKKPALIKDRRERFLLSCDSVNAKGIMYLSFRLIDFKSTEFSGISQLVDRTDHEWQSRKVWIAIDSTGKRHGYGAEDSTRSTLSPGGPFQPLFIQQLGSGYHAVNSGWIVEDTIDVPENAVPAPMLRFLSSMRARKAKDTLNQACLRCESTISAQGGFFTKTSNDKAVTFSNSAVIAGYGILHLSKKLRVPIHFYGTSENKNTVRIATPKGKSEQTLKHYILSNYTLIKMVSPRGNYSSLETTRVKKNKSTQKKK